MVDGNLRQHGHDQGIVVYLPTYPGSATADGMFDYDVDTSTEATSSAMLPLLGHPARRSQVDSLEGLGAFLHGDEDLCIVRVACMYVESSLSTPFVETAGSFEPRKLVSRHLPGSTKHGINRIEAFYSLTSTSICI